MGNNLKVRIFDGNHIEIEGRIDSSNAHEFEDHLKTFIDKGIDSLSIDAEKLTYISSAGLRVLMKIKKCARNPITIENVSNDVYQILEMTGFSQLFIVKKGFRRLSIEGCPVIGQGFYGTVYRLDPDTIVKVYRSTQDIAFIENEQRMAKAAFLKGIPTAISYDIVKVGDCYGSVFELLKAVSFNDLVIQHPESVDETVKQWCDLLKTVHSTEMEPGVLPSAKNIYMHYLDVVRVYLTDDQYQQLRCFIEKIPHRMTLVHGDFQMKNVMLSGNEPMLIDMDTLSTGHPIFELAGLYTTYKLFEEDEPGNTMAFLGIPATTADHIFNMLMENYLETDDATVIFYETQKIRLLASVRFLFIITESELKNGELGERRIRHTIEHINELLKRDNSYNL